MTAPRIPPDKHRPDASTQTVSPLGASRVGDADTKWAEWDAPSLDAPTLGKTLDELELKGHIASLDFEPELDPLTRHRLMLLLSTIMGIFSAAVVAAAGWLLLS